MELSSNSLQNGQNLVIINDPILINMIIDGIMFSEAVKNDNEIKIRNEEKLLLTPTAINTNF